MAQISRWAGILCGAASGLTDRVLKTLVRQVNPRAAVAAYFAFNAALTGVFYRRTETWSDFYTSSGYFITVTGLFVAVVELYRTRTHGDAIAEATGGEATRRRAEYYRRHLERLKSLVGSGRQFAASKRWNECVLRINDLAADLSYTRAVSPSADENWERHAEALQLWVTQFTGYVNNRPATHDMRPWHDLTLAIIRDVNGELAVYQNAGEGAP